MLRALLALITITIMGLNTAKAEEYFIQITAIPKQVIYVDEADTPGGIEVYVNDKFITCAQAFTVPTWNGDQLAPFSYGFMSKYPLKDFKFKPRGALSRVVLETKETKTE